MTTNREEYEALKAASAAYKRTDRPRCHCDLPLSMPGTPDVCGNCAGGIGPEPAQNDPSGPTGEPATTTGPDLADADIYDATNPTGIKQLPSVMTSLTPAAFKSWLAADGQLFVVYLPGRRSFIIKVPDVHNAFFVSMMQQVKFALGSDEVQAVRMTVVTGPPPDLDERGDPIPPADGKADQTPNWARPSDEKRSWGQGEPIPPDTNHGGDRIPGRYA